MAAEIEEVVVRADAIDLEDVAPLLRDQLFDRGARRREIARQRGRSVAASRQSAGDRLCRWASAAAPSRAMNTDGTMNSGKVRRKKLRSASIGRRDSDQRETT